LDETNNLHSINSRLFTLKWSQFPTQKRDRYIHMKAWEKSGNTHEVTKITSRLPFQNPQNLAEII
jgi:hypothetical protein